MTSWEAPDYKIKSTIPEVEYPKYIDLSGNAFEIRLSRIGRKKAIEGMIIIPETCATLLQENKGRIQGALWIDSKKAIIPIGENIKITLIKPCDPMWKFEKATRLLCKRLPFEISGVISKVEPISEALVYKVKNILRGKNKSR